MGRFDFPSCEESFETKRGRGVHHAHAHGERLPNRTCDNCSTPFYSDYAKRYCSRQCLLKSDSYVGENAPNYRGAKEKSDCQICGAEFHYYPSDKEGLFCSDCVKNEKWRDPPTLSGSKNPRWGGGKQSRDCVVCGRSVQRYPSEFTSDTICCSEECRRHWLSDSFTGEGHPNWKGGGNEAYGEGWAAVRRKALKRDGYACIYCGVDSERLGRNPDVHHIVPVRRFIEVPDINKSDAHTLSNVVSLCVSCHRKADFGKISRTALRALIDASQGDISEAEDSD